MKIFTVTNLNAQLDSTPSRLDSLKSLLAHTDSHKKGDIALQIANLYPRGELDSTQLYVNLAIHKALKHNNNALLAKAYVKKSWLFITPLHQFDSTLYYAENSLKLMDTTQYSKILGKAYNNKAIALVQIGKALQGLEYFKKTLNIYKAIDDKCSIATSLHNIAKVYKYLDHHYDAVEYFKESLAIKILNNCKDNYAYIYFNLAGIFENLGEIDSTIYFVHKTLATDQKFGSKEHIIPAQYILGKMYLAKDYLDSAKIYLYKANNLSLEQDNSAIRKYTLYELAKYHNKINQTDSALYHLLVAKKLPNVSIDLDISIDSLQYQLYKQKEDHKNAIYYLEKFKQKSDSLEGNKVAVRLEEFQAEKKANQIKILSQKNKIISYQSQKSKTQLLILFSLLCFSFMFFGYIFYSNRKKHLLKLDLLKTENNLKYEQLHSKALRAQMNPHFIFNTLNSIKHYALFRDKEQTSQYITDFSSLIRNILEKSQEQLIPLKNEIEILNLYIDIERKRFRESFDYEINIDESLDTDELQIPPLLLQPYVENAIWHGLMPKTKEKKLQINILETEQGFRCEIVDNGVGRNSLKIDTKKKTKTSLGTKITAQRIEQLNKISHIKVNVQIIDLISELSEPLGTKVILDVNH